MAGGGDHHHHADGAHGGDFRGKVWSMTGGPNCRPIHWTRNTTFTIAGIVLICIPIAMKSVQLEQRRDAAERFGFTPLQKCTVAIRQLAYGGPADHYDEYLRVAESTGIECLQKFCRCVIEVFGNYYLRKPTDNDVRGLMRMHEEKHGFPGMLGSLDCMHWEWKNCPVAWKGQYTRGDIKAPTIMLEAVASQNLWIWHAFFGVAGSNNDINVLGQSPLFNDTLQGFAPMIPFTVNGTQYTRLLPNRRNLPRMGSFRQELFTPSRCKEIEIQANARSCKEGRGACFWSSPSSLGYG